MNKKIRILILLIFFTLGLVLRLYKLGLIPPGTNWDETVVGYTGYSILKTGKDEWGKKIPIFTKGFGDYRSAVYSYLTTVPIKIFGLTPFAIRFPAAVLGSTGIIAFYFLIKNLFEFYNLKGKSKNIAVIGAFLFTINPWNFFFSRYGFDVSSCFIFGLFSLTFVFLFLNKKKYLHLFFSIIFACLSIYSYHNARIVIPFVFLFLFVQNFSIFIKNRKQIALVFLTGILLFLPFLIYVKTGFLSIRTKELSIFSNYWKKHELEKLLVKSTFLRSFAFFYKYFFYFQEIFKNILRNLSLKFLFLGEDLHYRFGIKYYGRFLYPSLIFLFLGLFKIWTRNKKLFAFLTSFILVSTLPAALTVDSPHPLRVYFLLIPLLIIITFGIYYSFKGKAIKFKRRFLTGAFIVYMLFLSLYINAYFNFFNEEADQNWQYFYRELVESIDNQYKDYNRILFDIHWGQPHIFMFFYQKIDPLIVQKEMNRKDQLSESRGVVSRFQNIHFKDVHESDILNCHNCLIIEDEKRTKLEKNKVVKELENIKLNNGNTIFWIYKTI